MRAARSRARLAVAGTTAGALLAAVAVAAPGAVAASSTYTQPGHIKINEFGAATPYPSALTVTAANRGVTDLNLTLSGLSHKFPDDLIMMLVGPAGQRAVVMSRSGDRYPVNDLTLTLDDEAAAPLPHSSALSTGTFRPTDHDTATAFPGPAPPSTGAGSALSVFDGTDPNGVWHLFVVDQVSGDVGRIAGGWSLRISTVDAPAAPAITSHARSSTDTDGRVALGGTASAGSTVRIYEGATHKGHAVASGTGTWAADLGAVADGRHTYTAKATDGFDNVSRSSTGVTVVMDTVSPSGGVTIDKGATRTNRTAARLSFAAKDAAPASGLALMRFSNDGATWSAFEPFRAGKTWGLKPGNGNKAVSVQFADRAGNVSATASDTIVLDMVSPRVTRTKPAEGGDDAKVGASITATFGEAMRTATITRATVRLVKAGTKKSVRARVTYLPVARKVKINPRRHLAADTRYKVIVGTGVRDLAGNRLDQKRRKGNQPLVWRFTTR